MNSTARDKMEIEGLTEQQLRDNLVTCDFRGQNYKTMCLDRLLGMERVKTAAYLTKIEKA